MKKFYLYILYAFCIPIFLQGCSSGYDSDDKPTRRRSLVPGRPTILLPQPEKNNIQPSAIATLETKLSATDYFTPKPTLVTLIYVIKRTIPARGITSEKIGTIKFTPPTQLDLAKKPHFVSIKENRVHTVFGEKVGADGRTVLDVTHCPGTEEVTLSEYLFSDGSRKTITFPDFCKDNPYRIKRLPAFPDDSTDIVPYTQSTGS